MNNKLINSLNNIFKENKDKRICVVATSCAGKSTLLKSLSNCLDMDDVLFPLLTKEETDYVCSPNWTEEIGIFMDNLAKTKIKIKPGFPVFGTVILDADLIIFLHINDELLESRCASRESNFIDSKNMQDKIEDELKNIEKEIIKLEM